MTTKVIKRGKVDFVLESERPVKWTHDSTVTVDVIDLQGSVIVDGGTVDVYTGDTLAVAAVAGDFEVVLSAGNAINAGERIALGSDLKGYQIRTVESYDTATKTITLENCLDENLDVGNTVSGEQLSYTLDASDSAFDSIKEVSVRWISDGDGLTMTEMWDVSSVENQPAGLVADFTLAYPACNVPSDQVERLADRAEQWMISYFEVRLRDYKRIVDNEVAKETLMAKMAMMVAVGGDLQEEQYVRIVKTFDDGMSLLDGLPIWIDDNENAIEDEGETEKAVSISISRGLM